MFDLPPMHKVADILFKTEPCIHFLELRQILPTSILCDKCGKVVMLNRDRGTFRCTAKRCRREVGRFKGTFFAKVKLSCDKVMLLGYEWLRGSNHKALCEIGHHSAHTITSFLRYFRGLVANTLNEEHCFIGGNDITVEIDESKLAKRKHNRGHHVRGVWVVGGVERTIERRCFLVIVDNRGSETLETIIRKNVHEGSKIITDCWKGYSWLDNTSDYIHESVNHSKWFKDPETLEHTNTIEGTWSGLKRSIPPRTRTETAIRDCLLEFIWR